MSADSETPPISFAYARFVLRLQGIFIDWLVFCLVLIAVLIIADAIETDGVVRILGFTVIGTWLVYDPLLVSFTGGTLGHHFCNMRVVDDRHRGNISLGKAIIRMVIKIALGLASFVSMAVAYRHQALHDFLTGSTVQIRNLAKAKPYHFSTKRNDLPPGMPSLTRRIVVILAYFIGWCIIWIIANMAVIFVMNPISDRCIYRGDCSYVQNLYFTLSWLGWLAIVAVLIGLGWRGRLLGARLCLVDTSQGKIID